jgi:hypothetical protein
MIAVDLDTQSEKHLKELADAEGEAPGSLARRILLDFLHFHALPPASNEAWAEASIALATEILKPEDWGDGDHGPR